MPQVLVTQRIEGLERRTYAVGVVVTFSDAAIVALLKSQRQVDDTPAVVAAALAAGAPQVEHLPGFPSRPRTVSVDTDPDTGAYRFEDDVARAVRSLGPMVWIDVSPDAGQTKRTAQVQAVLNACRPGQMAVLPPPTDDERCFVRCDDITLPAGVSLDSAGSIPLGWTVRFGSALSQAYNSTLGGMWMKQCRVRIKGDIDTGTSSGGNAGRYFYDTSKNWTPGQWKGWWIRIDSGPGAGQVKTIIGNTATRLEFASAFGVAPDNTSTYSINARLSAIKIDGTQFDGTGPDHTGSTSGNCFEVDNLGYDIKLMAGTQIWNYYGTGLGIYGNPDRANNTGTPYLATGVFVTAPDLKIFNCGRGIHMRGGAKDGSSFHGGALLLDHCLEALVIDDSVNGNVDQKPELSGGITFHTASLRCELCGYNNGASGINGLPSITNIRGNVNIGQLWYSSSIGSPGSATDPEQIALLVERGNNYKNIHHRRGSFVVHGGRMVKGSAAAYGIYCDPGVTATCDWSEGATKNIGLLKGVKGHVGASNGARAVMRFELTKTAGGITMQHLATDGRGWGTGTGAGDQFNATVSADMTKGGATQSLGGVFDKIHYQWMDTGIVRIYPEMRSVTNVLMAVLHKETTALTRTLTVNVRIQAGDTGGFRVEFYVGGSLLDLANNAQVPVGSKIEFSVEAAFNDIGYATTQVPAVPAT